jgi:protein-S-isoprenylcysteine O-methyltransferase Ste14
MVGSNAEEGRAGTGDKRPLPPGPPPIYSGILGAGVDTAVALSWLWLIAVGPAGVCFLYSATVEERYLTEQFADTYPMYQRSTKMLVPFLF